MAEGEPDSARHHPRRNSRTTSRICSLIYHIVKLAGVDHVGLGSDFDGVPMLPAQLQDVSTYPYITQALLDRGYKPGQIKKIMGDNLLRALREAEKVSRELQK